MGSPEVETAGQSLYQGGDVKCTQYSCHAVFTPVVYEVGDGTGLRVEFACPECRHKYIIAHIDKRGLEIRAQLEAIGRQTPKASMSVINERVRTVRRLKKMLKKHVRKG